MVASFRPRALSQGRRSAPERLAAVGALLLAAAGAAAATAAFVPRGIFHVFARPSSSTARGMTTARFALMEVPGDIKKGLKILVDGIPCKVVQFESRNVGGKGKWTSEVRLLNMFTGQEVQKVLQGGTKYEEIATTRTEATYSYSNEGTYFFMDAETYEEFGLGRDVLGEVVDWLTEGALVSTNAFGGKYISITLKDDIAAQIASVQEFSNKGPDIRAQTGGQQVTLTNGITMRTLKAYIKQGDRVLIDKNTFEIKERI